MKKYIKHYIAVISAIILASCSPVYAISMCPGVANLAGIYSQMQYVNNELAKQGEEPKYSRETELQDVHQRLNNKYLPMYVLAVEYGFNNPDRDAMYVWRIVYDQCKHWMFMNDYKDY